MGNDSLGEGVGGNVTCPDPHDSVQLNNPQFIAPICVLIVFNLCVIGGNILVIVAVFTHRKLRSVTNKFIVSLAVADLMLGVAVLPFSSATEVLRYWPFGNIWCSIWLAVDVWLSTASILNLCAISLDRYLAISRPFKYPTLMSPMRGKALIVVVWATAFLICFPPLIGWNERGKGLTERFEDRAVTAHPNSVNVSDIIITNVFTWAVRNATTLRYKVNASERAPTARNSPVQCAGLPGCMLTSDPGYIVYSALGSFWIPAFVMTFFYWRIYRTAALATGNIRRGVLTTKTGELPSSTESSVTLRIHRGRYGGESIYSRPSRTSYEETMGNSIGLLSAENTPSSRRKVSETSLGNNNKNLPSISEEGTSRDKARKADKHSHKGKKKKKKPKIKVTFTNTPRTEPCSIQLLNERDRGTNRNRQSLQTNGARRTTIQQNGTNLPYVEVEESRTMLESDYGDHINKQSRLLNKVGRIHLKTHLKRLNKEKKAAKTVGIIVGCFIICWLPFFTVYLLGAFCSDCTPPLVFTIFFWLGYCNSAINPCLYALCSKDFRYAFQKLLCCRWERPPLYPSRGRGTSRLMTFINSLKIQISSKESDSNSE